MLCKNCGAEIADKALICYKCGTATTEAKYQPAQLRRRRGPSPLIIILIVALLLLAMIYYFRLG